MTSWPWMKGIDTPVAMPVPPVSSDDDRPSVQELLDQHRDKIDKIAAGLTDHPLYQPSKHDDVWILRFWLSHQKSKKAIDAAKATLEFRSNHKLDETDIRANAPHKITDPSHPVHVFLSYTQDGAICYVHPDASRGVVAFLNFKKIHQQHVMVKEQPESLWLLVFMYFSEWSFQWLDYVTRTSGRLTKSIRMVDMTDTAMGDVNKEFVRRVGKAMGVMEDCYPQLLDGLYACNPPSVVHVLWTMIRPIMPKRVVAKIDFMTPANNEKELRRLHRYISNEHLPTEFGGIKTTPVKDW